MGSNKILNLEKGYDLDPVWGGFNEEYRNIIAKKLELQRNDVLWCHFLYILFRLSHISVNDETCLNVESDRVLEKGTFECRNVGKLYYDRIKYC